MKPLSALVLIITSLVVLVATTKEIIEKFPPYQAGQCIRYVCSKNGACDLEKDSLWIISHNEDGRSHLLRLNQKDKTTSDQILIGFTKLRSFPYKLEECPNETFINFDVDTDI